MVLGPTLEISLRRGLIITNGTSAFFVGHPIAAVLLVIAILMLSLPIVRALRARTGKSVS